MHPLGTDTVFAGSIPQLYERYLVPLIFEPYAADLALRTVRRQPSRVLEIAAGTKHPPRFSECPCFVGEEHDPELAYDHVKDLI